MKFPVSVWALVRGLAVATTMLLLAFGGSAGAQSPAKPDAAATVAKPRRSVHGEEYSGMYTFLVDGEFLQVSVGEQGKVTGFVSRFGETDSDRGQFLDHFFKEGKLEGDVLTLTSKVVHGIWYEFTGRVERGPAKDTASEGFYELRGVLRQNSADASGKPVTRERDVVFKRFPDAVTNPGAVPR